MSINGVYQFGSLTTKSGRVINFDDIDLDKDGKISQQEFNFIQKELGMDTLELTDEKQKGEKKVTDYEYVLWSQESQMQDEFDKICTQVAKDFIGANAQYSSQVLKELRQFLKDYKQSYIDENKTIIGMADSFREELPKKYEEIKQEYLGQN